MKKKIVNLLILYEVNNEKVFRASFIGKSKKISDYNLLKLL